MSNSHGSLTPLQVHALTLLADVVPRWTLSGGAALGLRLGYRPTRDIDLFWQGTSELGEIPRQVRSRLEAAGLEVDTVQTSPAFVRLSVFDSAERLVVDLVASPVEVVSPPESVSLEDQSILVDSDAEILSNKLCALLGRSEVRDLWDVLELLERGGDLELALRDAARKDGGFSSLTLAWVLNGLALESIARAIGLDDALTARLTVFKQEFLDRLTRLSVPDDG